MTSADPKNPRDEESFKERLTEKLDKLKNDERTVNLLNYAKTNTRDTIAYVALIIGIILLFFHPMLGGLIIGLIAGLYFSDELIFIAKHFNELIEEQGLVRVLVLGALFISFFIVAPFIYFGAFIGALIMKVVAPNK